MRERRASLLRRVALFSELDAKDFEAIMALARVRTFRTREVVVRQGDPGGDVYAVLQGQLKVTVSGADGRDVALGIMGPGEIFGEIALLDGEPRSATVSALSNVELTVVEQEAFRRLLESTPQLSIRLLCVLARRVRRLSERADDIACLDVGARLAKKVVELAGEYGQSDSDNAIRLDLRLSQQDIGELVGATRESVNKHLRLWTQEGLIQQRQRCLVITDLNALKILAIGA